MSPRPGESRAMTRLRALVATMAVLAAMAATIAPSAPAGATTHDWTLGGVPCDFVPFRTADAPPVGTGACPGVRPGAVVNSEVGQCTFNFMFKGSDGDRYMGTAGHCILDGGATGGDVGERTWARGTGPVARDADGNRVGEWAYAILQDPKDFSLIRLDPGVAASPQMCHFGGPTGRNDELTSDPVILHHFGQGLALGETVPARTHVAPSMPDPNHVYANGIAIFGDSGSGVIDDTGKAVGVLVTIGIHVGQVGDPTDAGFIGITRLGPQQARASQVLGIRLKLLQAPLM
jgi:hypothetical protein